MYVSPNFKTKKQLKETVKARNAYDQAKKEIPPGSIGAVLLCKTATPRQVRVFSPGPFPCPTEGWICVEGPHFPQPHKWYAQVFVENGVVKEVK